MSGERASVRPVSIGRLVEVVNACEDSTKTVDTIEGLLDTSRRRANEVASEAARIGLIKQKSGDTTSYRTSELGEGFLSAVRSEDWGRVGNLLYEHSPHYTVVRETLQEVGPATEQRLLEFLQERETKYRFNETGVDVVCDWAERLGDIQRHAFSGRYYVVEAEASLGAEFETTLLSAYEDLNESVGLDVHQHYVSIPRLRERVCERMGCTRDAFDEALIVLVDNNIGKLELTGAPRDTTAKDAVLGIKEIEVSKTDDLVTTVQSTDRVLRGIEYRDKQYYYLADHRPERQITPREQEECR